jgi:hypothetical protein
METKPPLFDQALDVLKAFHRGHFAEWYPRLSKNPDFCAWLYKNNYLRPVMPECKQSCIDATKRHFLEQGAEIGTEAVRNDMNNHYLNLVQEFMVVDYLEGMTQREADELLKRIKNLDSE